MTWELRSAAAMGRVLVALIMVVVASGVGAAAQAKAMALGELHAVPSHAPPYIFRLPLITPRQDPAATAAVKVQQPPDTIAFVKQQMVEFRLRTLTDVELEVSYAGQTLNRLLPKSELQTARLRVETVPTANLSLPARAKGHDRAFPEALVTVQPPVGAIDHAAIEGEMEGIRQAIHSLVAQVAPVEGFSRPVWGSVAGSVTTWWWLMLGGCAVVGVASLCIGFVRQRRAMDRERRRQRALTLALRRLRDQLATGVPILPMRQQASLSPAPPAMRASVSVIRRRRVAEKTPRRFRGESPNAMRHVTAAHGGEPLGLRARSSQRLPSAPAELLEALALLRGELMRLQGRWPSSPPVAAPEAGSRWVWR
jgi:hypothetical protein